MKTLASSLLIAISALGAGAAYADPGVNNETGSPVFSFTQPDNSHVTRAQVVQELQGARAQAPVSNEVGPLVNINDASNVTRAQVRQDLSKAQNNASLYSVYFGA